MNAKRDLKTRLGPEKYQLLVRKLNDGVTQKRIAKDLGYTEQWMVKIVRDYKAELTK